MKLQALVRGHQVRKQANTTLRRMHALMAIQVRARVQRIQVAEEAQIVVNRQSSVHRNFHQDNWLRIGLGVCLSHHIQHFPISEFSFQFIQLGY